ncbi:MAG: hypothetical protein IPN94_14905 [Sphingobacteriales bacterium]|nr:hypothetical protein [Sphingobacteriales bacterium]
MPLLAGIRIRRNTLRCEEADVVVLDNVLVNVTFVTPTPDEDFTGQHGTLLLIVSCGSLWACCSTKNYEENNPNNYFNKVSQMKLGRSSKKVKQQVVGGGFVCHVSGNRYLRYCISPKA